MGDDVVNFVDILVADNNTWSSKKFIQSQHQIKGTTADNKTDKLPDFVHKIKKCSKKFYEL